MTAHDGTTAPLTLDAFVGRLATAELTLPDGSTRAIRALTVAEERALTRPGVLPEPDPPMKKDPDKGSASPRIFAFDDPGYIAAHTEWRRRYEPAELAVAMGYEPKSHGAFNAGASEADMLAWADAAARELTGAVSRAWLRRACDTLNDLSMGKALEKAGLGNSGASGTEGTAN